MTLRSDKLAAVPPQKYGEKRDYAPSFCKKTDTCTRPTEHALWCHSFFHLVIHDALSHFLEL